MVFETILNPIFYPVLSLHPFWAILIISLVLSLLMTFVYKWVTNQHLMKTLKEDMKKFQKDMKDNKHDTQKVMEIQKKAMETNMQYMKHSLKPTLITFIPIIIIFGWLNAHLAYEPIMPNQNFTVTASFQTGVEGIAKLSVPDGLKILGNATQDILEGTATWSLKGKEGEYLLEIEKGSEQKQKDLIITSKREYSKIDELYKDSAFTSIKINNELVHPLGSISLFGWKPGWIGTYIILSLIFSMSLRKLLKLH
jgi:uncharacterized membrane protein (DUF106 family)